jgi:hypothetical protein
MFNIKSVTKKEIESAAKNAAATVVFIAILPVAVPFMLTLATVKMVNDYIDEGANAIAHKIQK